MKKLLLLSALLILGCSGDDSSNDSNDSNCDLDNANLRFSQINADMNYSQVANIMGVDGNHFRTDNLGFGDVLKFYSWEYCDGGNNRIECWFKNDELLNVKFKSFSNNSCTNNVNQFNYSSISAGDSYVSISNLLDDQGDNYRSDWVEINSTNILATNFYRWYNCSNRSDYIEVWFDINGEAILITKSF